jgi:hypothetical protein
MEPGRGDREHRYTAPISRVDTAPQWSPVVETGSTREHMTVPELHSLATSPQWSPVVETGSTQYVELDRDAILETPQWSPVVETGSTAREIRGRWAAETRSCASGSSRRLSDPITMELSRDQNRS